MHPKEAGELADALIAREISRQDEMWGVANDRDDTKNCQLMHAGMAQLDALFDRHNGEAEPFGTAPMIFPSDWSGFRDYGSDVANLVVAVAFLRQEIKRKIAAGEETTRLARQASQPYLGDQPNPVSA